VLHELSIGHSLLAARADELEAIHEVLKFDVDIYWPLGLMARWTLELTSFTAALAE
jgi:hypothetical protein